VSDSPHAHSFHRVGAEHTATVWDNAAAPVLEIESGETVWLECRDASGGEITPASTAADVPRMDMAKVNPVTGPVYVRGAQPGDTLVVEILELVSADWGWTAIIPGFGLLADEFPDPWLNIATVDPARRQVHFLDGVTLPFAPFPGTIGVAPAEPGRHSVLPPSTYGGNIDVKHLRPGATLYLPVGVPGALFSVGDTHAAMGDAEVCGTAVETAMSITVRLSTRSAQIPAPQFHLPAGALAGTERSSHHVCTGVGPPATRLAPRSTTSPTPTATPVSRPTRSPPSPPTCAFTSSSTRPTGWSARSCPRRSSPPGADLREQPARRRGISENPRGPEHRREHDAHEGDDESDDPAL
jgi:acetamidase/formamidase